MDDVVYPWWREVILWLLSRLGERDESEGGEEVAPVERRATVVNVDGRVATLEYEEGVVQAVEVPDKIGVQVGLRVRVLHRADGRLLYLWGGS